MQVLKWKKDEVEKVITVGPITILIVRKEYSCTKITRSVYDTERWVGQLEHGQAAETSISYP